MKEHIIESQRTANILMATYNGEKYIEKQIRSIAAQTYKNWKLYIHDDGSLDSTLQIINRMIEEYSTYKIVLLQDDVKGVGACENFSHLLRNCDSADFYFICDQDDIWQKDKIEVMITAASNYNVDLSLLFFHDMQIIDNTDKIIASSLYEFSHIRFSDKHSLQQLLTHNSISGCVMMINHTFKNRLGAIPKDCIIYDWWIALSALMVGGSIVHIEKILSSYRIHESNAMGLHNTLSISWVRNAIQNKHYRRYHDNNIFYKKKLHQQADELMLRYISDASSSAKQVVTQFLILLDDKNRLRALYKAYQQGYVLTNHLETLKFYLF